MVQALERALRFARANPEAFQRNNYQNRIEICTGYLQLRHRRGGYHHSQESQEYRYSRGNRNSR